MTKSPYASAKEPMLSLSAVRTSLLRVWLIGAGCTALILVVASILRGRVDAARDAWSWFLPLILPTLGLMGGVVGAAAMNEGEDSLVRSSFFQIAWWLSSAYLAILSLTILLEPLTPLSDTELFGMSNYWMGPLQGFVVAMLGYVFTSAEKKGDTV